MNSQDEMDHVYDVIYEYNVEKNEIMKINEYWSYTRSFTLRSLILGVFNLVIILILIVAA